MSKCISVHGEYSEHLWSGSICAYCKLSRWKIRKCVCNGCGGQWWMQRGTSPRFYVGSWIEALESALRLTDGPVPGDPRRGALADPWAETA